MLRKAWVVRVQRNILTGNPPQPGYVRTLSEYDCDQSRTRWREFSAYSRSGASLISKRNPNPEWGPATEAGDIYSAFKVVCQGGGDGAVVSAESVAKVVISLMASWDPPPAPMTLAPTAAAPFKGAMKRKPTAASATIAAAKAPSAQAPVPRTPPVTRPKAP